METILSRVILKSQELVYFTDYALLNQSKTDKAQSLWGQFVPILCFCCTCQFKPYSYILMFH